ncbi:MAG TPA: restriction endonuclease [Pyrinomonadaceae bacterium]|jgi:tetratricopeptide (TPR) repeat protein|nr:restriction endonuclease [Pyrinomonadaceae bacterium]
MEKPGVTKTNHLLPFGELSSGQFERLCLWLVEREGYENPEHLGEGGAEDGRDVIAYRVTGGGRQLWYFQCKRYARISAARLIKEAEKYNDLVASDPTKKPYGVIFVTNATLTAVAREKVRAFCNKHGYECEFWARTELDLLVKKHPEIVAEFFNIAMPKLPVRDKISIARLPATNSDLFGRDDELELLNNAWEHGEVNIAAFVAWGGVGKTALVNHWLKKSMANADYRGAELVYGWSFYSQGTSERVASADLFIDQALRWFGDPDPTFGTPWDKGERLAGLIRQTRTLLILDGIEPLQFPPGAHEGRLKDNALQALLVELAAGQPGLCVISTRERIGDLAEFENGTVIQHDLDNLTPQAGAQLLRAQQVIGSDHELEKAAEEYQGHALALTLLGGYLADVYDGDIRQREAIENLENDARHGRHAERVMRAYEKWLGEGAELAVLRLLGLFDRPADAANIKALRAKPAIPGLTDTLLDLKEREWKQVLAKLRRIGLLHKAVPGEPGTLDAHPLVREHFRQQLKQEHPAAWREANGRLYEFLSGTVKEFPDTIVEIMQLYLAVAHGCEAEKYQEVFDQIYKRRIHRGEEYFALYKLNAFGADLAALSKFPVTHEADPALKLTEDSKTEIISLRGYNLRALGRLKEAVEEIETALALRTKQNNWKNAAINAGNLSRIYLISGNLPQALKFARQGVEFADKSLGVHEQMSRRAILAHIFHQLGKFSEAEAAFQEAEKFQIRREPKRSILDSLAGFWYCEILLDQGKFGEVIACKSDARNRDRQRLAYRYCGR